MRRIFQTRLRGLDEGIRSATTAVFAHKLRSMLTVLGIIIGVATVISMVAIIQGFNNNVISNFQSFGATLVQFQKHEPRFGPGGGGNREEIRRRKNLTYEDALALKALAPSMAAVSPERYWFGGPDTSGPPDVIYRGVEATPDTIVGVTEDYPAANNHFIGEGRFISASDVHGRASVVVLGFSIMETLFPHVDPIGKEVWISGRKYRVAGIMARQGQQTFFESVDSHVYLPLTTYDSHFPWIKKEQGVNIATIPKRPELVPQVIEEGTAILRARRGVRFNQPNDFGIMTPDKLIDNFRAITSGITMAMLFISSIALLIGGIGVMNIMLVSVTERTREIGLRKALGGTKRDIVTQFLLEAVTLSAVGGLLGVAIGAGIATAVGGATPLPTSIPLWSVLLGVGVSVGIGLFFGIYPAWKAARLDPVEALRYE